MLTDPAPLFIHDTTSSPVLGALLQAIGGADVIAVPLLAGSTFMGVATAGGRPGRRRCRWRRRLVRLQGLGDQASTALQKAARDGPPPGDARRPDRSAQPRAVPRPPREGARRRSVPVPTRVCCSAISTGSSRSTTRWATPPGTNCCARSPRGCVPRSARDTVGRLSGDEFAIILPALVGPDDVRRLADRVDECFAEPFRLEGKDVVVGTSVGVAVHDDASPAPPSSCCARPTPRCTGTSTAAAVDSVDSVAQTQSRSRALAPPARRRRTRGPRAIRSRPRAARRAASAPGPWSRRAGCGWRRRVAPCPRRRSGRP